MKICKDFYDGDYDLAICGLGYESRSTWVASNVDLGKARLAIGYRHHTDVFSYQENKKFYSENNFNVSELTDEELEEFLSINCNNFNKKINVVIDITVMSRHRLAIVIWHFLSVLDKGSTITITYCLSKYLEPPSITPPVKEIGCIINNLSGIPSDIGTPTALIIFLGYEQNKALGAANYIDPQNVYAFIPKSQETEFETKVIDQNRDLLIDLNKNIFFYNVHQPYVTYLDLKSLVLDVLTTQKPILLPLGPKIVAALAVFLGKDIYPHLPVWRVSSNGCEEPIDRVSSGHRITFTVEL